MNRTVMRSLFVITLSAGLMAPAHAFDIRMWFNSLSERSRSAIYLGAATVVAGLLAYTLCWKKKAQPIVKTVRSEQEQIKAEPESQMKEMSAAQQRILADTSLPMNAVKVAPLHKKVLKKVSAKSQSAVVTSMVRDYDINQDKDLVACKNNYEYMHKLCDQALERVKKAIADNDYEQAKQQHKELLSIFKQEQQKVYKQVIDLLEPVKEAISQNKPSEQIDSRKWLLIPWKAEIERLEYYFNKVLSKEIEEMNKKSR